MVYSTRGCRFDPGSGHSSFYFFKGNLLKHLVLKLPGSNADSVSKGHFLPVQFKKFPNPSSKSNDIAYFFAYFHPLVIRLICRKAIRQMHTQHSKILVMHLSISFPIAEIITCPDSSIGRAMEY